MDREIAATNPALFPVRGVVGVLGGEPGEIASGLLALEETGAAKPDALEVRADLFERPMEAVELVQRLRGRVPVVFTVRLRSHGGRWEGDESGRISLLNAALASGAALVDAEWDSPAARELARARAPLVVSHHDFSGMMDDAALQTITRGMLELGPMALKCVPTARTQSDGLTMLEWTARAEDGGPRRLGFAMGEMGFPSRALSIAWGAPFTYASLNRAVAPGQVSVAELRGLCRSQSLTRRSRVYGVAGNPVAHSLSPYLHNRGFAARGIDAVYLPFRTETFPELVNLAESLGIHGLSVTIPFKEAALSAAHEPDERSRSAGAANTLVFARGAPSPGGSRIRAFNTDFDGVLEPLRRRNLPIASLQVAIIGNGGAARGAARALLGAGANVTLYYRDPDRGAPVARALGVNGRELKTLTKGSHQLLINATPLGLHAGDASPVHPDVFASSMVAFDMIYDPPETRFLADARAAGAGTIPGREMLICQAIVQFRHFTGCEASYEELEAAFLEGQSARRGA